MPSQLPAGTNLSSPQIKLIHDWNEAFMERNMENFAKHMHTDFRRLVYPQSLDQPEQSKEEALKELSEILDLLIGFDVGHTPNPLLLGLASPWLNLLCSCRRPSIPS